MHHDFRRLVLRDYDFSNSGGHRGLAAPRNNNNKSIVG